MSKKVAEFLKTHNSLLLSTCSYSNPNIASCSYLNDDLELYIAGVENSVYIRQIQYNPKVVVTIKNDNTTLTYSGLAKIETTHLKKENILKTLSKKDSLSPQGIFRVVLVKISPINIQVPDWDYEEEFKENKPSVINDFIRSAFSSVRVWLDAIRFPFISVSVLAVLVGTAVAFAETRSFSWRFFLLAFFGIALFHASADLFNDFFDHILGSDEINLQKTPFSGGSRMIQLKVFSPSRVLAGAIISLLGCITIGFYLNFSVQGNVIVYIGLVGAFLGIFYVGIPFKLAHYGLGEIAIFLSFGPAIVFGSYYLQTEQFSWYPIYVSILIGLLISLILFINQFPDFEADEASGKKHLVIRIGKKASTYVFIIAMSSAFLILILLVILKILPLISLIVLITLPLPIKATMGLIKNRDNYLALIPSLAMTILTCLAYSILLSISLFVSPFI